MYEREKSKGNVSKKEDVVKDKLTIGLNIVVSRNIKKLLLYNNLTQNKFISTLKKKDEYCITASYFNRLINYPEECTLPLLFIVQCADYFGVSIDNLLDKEFEPAAVCKEKGKQKKIADIAGILDGYENNIVWDLQNDGISGETISEDDSLFVLNPRSSHLKSIMQEYNCYFYPTVSAENKIQNNMLRGKLSFKPDNDNCKVVFEIYTNKKNKKGENLSKQYIGNAVYSTATNSVYCSLRNDVEYCYIIFRYGFFNEAYQDCHMAKLLSSSAAKKDRYPTALRMFLSREEIAEKDLSYIAPHLGLNYSEIMIGQEALMELKKKKPEYEPILDYIMGDANCSNMYTFKEKKVSYAVEDKLGKECVPEFITLLRSYSYAFHYAKVGDVVYETLRDLLKSLGYYKEDNL